MYKVTRVPLESEYLTTISTLVFFILMALFISAELVEPESTHPWEL